MYTKFVLAGFCPQFNLGKDLVSERVTHDKAGMTMSTSKIN